MKLIEPATKKINIISSLIWVFVSAVLTAIFILGNNLADNYIKLVLALLITIFVINLAGILPLFFKKRNLDIINWGIFQSAILIMAMFANMFPAENHKAFWLGLVAICALYATTRLSSAWLFKKFNDIEKL